MKQYVKKSIAIIVMVVLIVSNCFTALAAAGWFKNGDEDNAKWYFQDSEGQLVKNTFRKSGEAWYWLNENGTLTTGLGGSTIEPIEGIFFTLDNKGFVNPDGVDINGKNCNINDLIQNGDIGLEGDLYRAYWKIAYLDQGKAWQYVEAGKKATGLISVDGFDYYADNDGNIFLSNRGTIVDGYYIMEDYTCARNRWISIENQWYYFGDDAKQVFGVKVINGETYDFGTVGYVDASRVPYGAITSIEFTDFQELAEVGEDVELQFKIYVEEKEWIASDSNATASDSNAVATGSNLPSNEDGRWEGTGQTVEVSDYSIFENAYNVSHKYRVNVGDFSTTVTKESHLKYVVETKMQIDWDRQMIRIPIKEMGAIFGELQIDDKKSEPFGIVCNYPTTSSKEDQIQDITNYPRNDQKVVGLRSMDSDMVAEWLKEDESVRKEVSFIESAHLAINGMNNVSKEITPEANALLGNKKVDILGLGLSVETSDDKIVFSVDKSTAPVPGELSNGNSTVALEINASGGGINSDELAFPVYVSLPIPKYMSSDKVKLFHVHGDMNEPVDIEIEDGRAEFVTSSFSTFIFSVEKSNSGGGGGGGSTSSMKPTSAAGQAMISETAGSWNQNENGWMFLKPDGTAYTNEWVYVKGLWYRIGTDGYMLQGWNIIDEKRYYLTPLTGAMQTGWLLENGVWYYLDTTGAMQTGWQLVDGVWYCLGADGKMLANTKTPDGYQVNESGAWIK